MRVTSHAEQLPEHTHDGACACGQHHSHAQTQLAQTALGLDDYDNYLARLKKANDAKTKQDMLDDPGAYLDALAARKLQCITREQRPPEWLS